MSRPIRDPDSTGCDWIHRGIEFTDQKGTGVPSAHRWLIHFPDGIFVETTKTKAEAVKLIDELVDTRGITGFTTCPDCTGQLRPGMAMSTDWYGKLRYFCCMDCRQTFVSQNGSEPELAA